MGYISDRAAQAINEIAKNAPSIDKDSYWKSFDEIMNEFPEDINLCGEESAAIYIASAIHEFSKMINAHIIEFYKHNIEEKYKED